jgi:anti-sigma factor ChrR (cupin superfamily)
MVFNKTRNRDKDTAQTKELDAVQLSADAWIGAGDGLHQITVSLETAVRIRAEYKARRGRRVQVHRIETIPARN